MPYEALLVKIPYTTNNIYVSLNGAVDVMNQIQTLQNKYRVYENGSPKYVIPYVMVQPKLKNKQEYKVSLY